MMNRVMISLAGLLLMGLLTASAQLPAGKRTDLLVLPPVIYSVVGHETNIYFASVLTAPAERRFLLKVRSAKGKQQVERWVFTPEASDVGKFPLSIEVSDLEGNIVANTSTVVQVATEKRIAGKELVGLAIGDSLTEAGVYTEDLLRLFGKAGGARFSLIGTHHSGGSPENIHEGYSGWKYEYFLARFDPKADGAAARQGTSPFIFKVEDKPVLDLPRYFRESVGGKIPDVITIFLGTNDVFSATDLNRAATNREVLENAVKLVGELRKAAPAAKIGILAPLAPAGQDAFGENYGCEFDSWSYRKNQMSFLLALQQKFSHRESEGLYFIPAYVNFDPASDYPVNGSLPRNARNSEIISRQSNAVHPAESGYQHVADAIFVWVVNVF